MQNKVTNDDKKMNKSDTTRVCAIINYDAEAYRGLIPDDRWHEPYMPFEELEEEIAAGIQFWGSRRMATS